MGFRKICIYGAGALGGGIAAKLAASCAEETDISAVARGAHLNRIRRDGLTLREDGADAPLVARLTATDDPRKLGAQDLVITGLKGHQLAAAAEGIAALLKPETRVVMILNGIPWWYFHGEPDNPYNGTQLEQLDPGGVLWRLIGPERVIGCVAYQGGEVVEPGIVHLYHKKRLILGEPANTASADIEAIAALLNRSGLVAETTTRIRAEIWSKLMNNAAFNPLSALTRATIVPLLSDPGIVETMERIMTEVKALAGAVGVPLTIDVAQRLEEARAIPDVRTSMLQDLLAGRPLEITPLLGIIVALGRTTGTPTPVCETVLHLVSRLDEENRRSR
ncbi:2-dehydropantoate 2-reductase [Rhizobiaceae bacterium BDR2-2]|uniref:2-dehydropantoate 2-reductase n=1 Tax=Ectorhizobium quercum TaxID=2965071 RepID=A0AAE3N0T6_9HYPH|nr:2-dehydropantoate 2-reductase [Ectorhizobium quercum]MCX8997857.1 2-dehydropantoate 2-reductase [Ectorhizobium quercum]